MAFGVENVECQAIMRTHAKNPTTQIVEYTPKKLVREIEMLRVLPRTEKLEHYNLLGLGHLLEPMLAKGEGRKRLSREVPNHAYYPVDHLARNQVHKITEKLSNLMLSPRDVPNYLHYCVDHHARNLAPTHISEPLNDNQHMENVILDAVI